jgi:hypothetical protein|uniref:hypothetical protein n=1 Tax=Cephaloticoccus sp. TaxID=1985742 RepID=UPI00404A5C05
MNLDTTPRTKAGTPIKIPGRPRKDSEVGGIHLLTYPTFKSWLAKNRAAARAWSQVADKRTFFIRLSWIAVLPQDNKSTGSHLAYCYGISPDLTCGALPVIRKYAQKITMEDHRGACLIPGLEKDAIGNLLPRPVTLREAKARHKARKAHEAFIQDTEGTGI